MLILDKITLYKIENKSPEGGIGKDEKDTRHEGWELK